MKKVITVVMAIVLCLSVFAACGQKKAADGKAKAKIILIDKDEKEYTYDIEFTDGATLRDALYEAKLISEETYGAMFVEDIDGHVANVLEDGCTWLPEDKDKKQIMGTFDEITLKDGDTLYLQYYVVPNFDD